MTAVAEYSALPEVRYFLGRSKRLLIGGRWVDAVSRRTFATVDPATGATLAEVAHAEAADVDRAVRAARDAFDDGPWPTMKPNERARLLWRVGDLIAERAAQFGELEALDNGKSAGVATQVDAGLAADAFRYYAGWATKIAGSTVNVSMPLAGSRGR